MNINILEKQKVGLLVVDVQDKLMRKVERSCEAMTGIRRLITAFQVFQRPIIVTEQYPQGLGETIPPIQETLGAHYKPFQKTTFSSLGDKKIRDHIMSLPVDQWIVCGIEAHICVLQTAKDLRLSGKEVVVPNDAITSCSIYEFSTSISEMKDCGIRVSTSETILFEILKDSKVSEFKAISQLVQCCQCETPCCG